MLKKTVLAFSLLFVFVLMSLSTRAEVSPDSLARVIGEDCLAFVEFPNCVETYERYVNLALIKFANNPELLKFLDTMKEKADEIPGVNIHIQKFDTEKIKAFAEELKGLFSGPLSIAVFPGETPSMVLSATIAAGKKAEVAAIADNIEARLSDIAQVPPEEFPKLMREIIDIDGTKATKVTPEGEDKSLYYVVTDNRFLFASEEQTIKSVLEGIKNPPQAPLFKSEGFVKSMESVKGSELSVYINFKQILNEIGGDNPFADMIKGLAYGMSFEGVDMADELSIMMDGMQGMPVVGQLLNKVVSKKTARYFPIDAKVYAAMAIPPAETVWPMLLSFPMIAQIEDMSQALLGASLSETLLPALGGEIALYSDYKSMAVEYALAIELKDADTVKGILDKISEVAQLGIKKYTYKEQQLYMLVNTPPMLQMNLMVYEGYLFAGTALAIKTAINRDEAKSLASSEELKKYWTYAEADAPAVFVYMDLKAMLNTAYDTMLNLVQMGMFGEGFEQIPPKDILLEHLIPLSMWVALKPDRAIVKSRGFMPTSLLSALAPMFLFVSGGQEAVPPPDFEEPEEEEVIEEEEIDEA